MTSGRAYLLPDDLESVQGYKCYKIYVPDAFEFISAFWGSLDYLARWVAWERDPERRGRVAATMWRRAIELSRAAGECDSEPPGDEIMEQLNTIIQLLQRIEAKDMTTVINNLICCPTCGHPNNQVIDCPPIVLPPEGPDPNENPEPPDPDFPAWKCAAANQIVLQTMSMYNQFYLLKEADELQIQDIVDHTLALPFINPFASWHYTHATTLWTAYRFSVPEQILTFLAEIKDDLVCAIVQASTPAAAVAMVEQVIEHRGDAIATVRLLVKTYYGGYTFNEVWIRNSEPLPPEIYEIPCDCNGPVAPPTEYPAVVGYKYYIPENLTLNTTPEQDGWISSRLVGSDFFSFSGAFTDQAQTLDPFVDCGNELTLPPNETLIGMVYQYEITSAGGVTSPTGDTWRVGVDGADMELEAVAPYIVVGVFLEHVAAFQAAGFANQVMENQTFNFSHTQITTYKRVGVAGTPGSFNFRLGKIRFIAAVTAP